MENRIKIPASVGILTLNNAKQVTQTLESVRDFADVYICDGNSTDGTQEIAKRYGARIVKQFETDEPNQKITDFGETRTKCWVSARFDWYLRVDADEYISQEAAEEIQTIVSNPNPPYLIYKIPIKYVWFGKVIDHTVTYPNFQIRLFRKDAVEGYTKIAHERVVVKPGIPVGKLKNCLYVPVNETYREVDARKLKRALDWDRLQYQKNLTLKGWVKGTLHTSALLSLYTVRLIKGRLSKGRKFSIGFDLGRFKYQILTWLLATRVVFEKIVTKIIEPGK